MKTCCDNPAGGIVYSDAQVEICAACYQKIERKKKKRENQSNHSALHKQCVNEIRKALGREQDFTLWENSKVQIVKGEPRAMPGLTKGSSDMLGILAPHGRLVALEMKTGSARPTDEQRMFLELVRKRGGFACIVQAESVDEAVERARAALDRARAGEKE